MLRVGPVLLKSSNGASVDITHGMVVHLVSDCDSGATAHTPNLKHILATILSDLHWEDELAR